jgi:DNA-binding XRE family transcriptional regulator
MTPREAAKTAGLTTYETGAPCKHGHLAPRYVASKTCVECHHQQKREAWQQKPKAIRAPQPEETFGQRLVKLRKRLALSQEELALRARVSVRSIWNYENDQKLPHFWQLLELAKQLESSLDYLCCRTNRRRNFL